MATEGTKFQVNYKLNDGTLINLYAKDVKDLETGLSDLGMVASLIRSTGSDLHGSAPAPALTVAAVADAFNATPVQAPAPTSNNACRHGVMAYREGVNASGKPWKGYMCPAPKGATDKCEPIWVR